MMGLMRQAVLFERRFKVKKKKKVPTEQIIVIAVVMLKEVVYSL